MATRPSRLVAHLATIHGRPPSTSVRKGATIRVSWLEGARWFWDTLVDADLAANTLGWQWAAGCGADAAPYFRIFNPTSQAEKFDPDGGYVRRWVDTAARDYPPPIVDHAQARLKALAALKVVSAGKGG